MRHVLFIVMAGVLGIMVGLVADAGIATLTRWNAEMNAKAEADLRQRARNRKFSECLREEFPMMRPLIASTWVDTRTGDKYDIEGTNEWNRCKAKV